MCNPQHIEWILEGVDAWNARRRTDPFTPDFSGADLDGAFRNAGKVDEKGRIDLAGVDLRDANFMDSTIVAADFISADLSSADLRGSHFWICDLSYANLSYASLNKYTNLTTTPLINVILNGTEAWRAMLHNPEWRFDPSKSFFNYNATAIDSIESAKRFIDLMPTIEGDSQQDTFHPLPGRSIGVTYYFRGESDESWQLTPSLSRTQDGPTTGKYVSESRIWGELASSRPQLFYAMETALDKWALAQHYEFKTRFLDITSNLLVALFWACQGDDSTNGKLHVFMVPDPLVQKSDSDTISIIANFARLSEDEQDLLLGKRHAKGASGRFEPDQYLTTLDKLYQLIREEKPGFKVPIDIKDLYKVFVVEPRLITERLQAQSGAFLVSGFHERLEQQQILSKNRRIPAYNHRALPVLGKQKESILEELCLKEITCETLLP